MANHTILLTIKATKKDQVIFSKLSLNSKNITTKINLSQCSIKFTIKLYLILCSHIKIDFVNSVIHAKNINKVQSSHKFDNSGLLNKFISGKYSIKKSNANHKLKISLRFSQFLIIFFISQVQLCCAINFLVLALIPKNEIVQNIVIKERKKDHKPKVSGHNFLAKKIFNQKKSQNVTIFVKKDQTISFLSFFINYFFQWDKSLFKNFSKFSISSIKYFFNFSFVFLSISG